MELIIVKTLIGFVVGALIGLTGVGGGVLLLPLLIFGLRVPASVAVGSDALFNFVTKISTGWVHMTKGTVRNQVVLALAAGSVPGSVVGVLALQHLKNMFGAEGVSAVIKTMVGLLLLLISAWFLVRGKLQERISAQLPVAKSFLWMSLIGLIAGILVGMTSVGSGSIVMMLMLLFYSYPPKVMVGTDIVHAVVLTGITSLLHFRLGNVDPRLVACLLIGSIPGGLLGSQLSTRLPVVWLQRILCAVLLLTGARMLWA